MRKWIIGVVVLAVVGFGAFQYQYGGLRVKRDMVAFGGHMIDCKPYVQDFYDPLSRRTMNRRVEGPADGKCLVQMQTYGPEPLVCNFPIEDMPMIGAGFADLAGDIDIFGNISFSYNSADETPLYVALNSGACTGG